MSTLQKSIRKIERRIIVKLEDFDYYLPEELIAQVPIKDRDQSRLLVLDRINKTMEDKVFKDIIRLVCDRIKGITEISTIRIDKAQNSNDIEISMNMEIAYGYNISEMAEEMKKQAKKELEYMTSVNISMVNVKIVKIEVDEEKLQEKALRYEKAVKNMTKLEKNKRKQYDYWN